MKYKYNVYCWVNPRSGFDVADTNRTMGIFKQLVEKLNPNSQECENSFKSFQGLNQGMTINQFLVESDDPLSDPENSLLQEIKKNYPEAVYITSEKISHLVPFK